MWGIIGLFVLYNLLLGCMNSRDQKSFREMEKKYGCYD